MLHTQKVLAELERQRALFTTYEQRHGQELAAYRAALRGLGQRFPSAATLEAARTGTSQSGLALDREPTGARPTSEYDRWLAQGDGGMPTLLRGLAFAHHEEARAWAEHVRGTTTIAVDGSQLMPWRDASVPVALVQAGLFENPHQPPTPYLKDVAVELLGPEELAGVESDLTDARSHDLLGYSEQMVHLRRFELETETLISRMEHHAGRPADTSDRPAAVAFFDGSLVVSFAMKMPAYYRDRYMAAVRRLQATSVASQVPLIGYIDTSYARDLVTLLRTLPAEEPLPEARGVADALLWQRDLAWGDRSPAFLVARGDLPTSSADEALGGVAFVYLRAAADRPPARVEFPRWVLDAGWLDTVMDVVRAEVIAANGYPYCIEAADAVAVISMPDRARFYALFQEYAGRAGFSLSFSHKATSKHRRRV
jgi:hypothetical protein